MKLDDIKALDVGSLAAPDCALFMWATDPCLEQAFEVLKAWGFTYKTVGFTWAKTNKHVDLDALGPRDFFMGPGYITRANTELCLYASRGKPKRTDDRSVRRLIVDRKREHSRKPDRVRDDIRRLFNGPCCELFARTAAPGWAAWGNETNKFQTEAAE